MSRFSKRNQTEEIIVSIGNGTTTCRSCKEEFPPKGGKKNLLNHFDPGQTFFWIRLWIVTGSIIFLHWDERKKKKRKIMKAREGKKWDYFFFLFFRRWIFRKTADSKIWIKLKKKILEEPKYFHKQILFANRYYFYLISAM